MTSKCSPVCQVISHPTYFRFHVFLHRHECFFIHREWSSLLRHRVWWRCLMASAVRRRVFQTGLQSITAQQKDAHHFKCCHRPLHPPAPAHTHSFPLSSLFPLPTSPMNSALCALEDLTRVLTAANNLSPLSHWSGAAERPAALWTQILCTVQAGGTSSYVGRI